ncbi:hypothetical protein DSO57_1004428 [Entomophthora muscae]|uniref:Uncharacterized protein n=1 Tax=Entomophthora muscae TaxID=34485 RepID=A0ACC2TJF3_9FUNG|nr:hypothetical protein DSO57_1004428 [Entomophthora muscae]
MDLSLILAAVKPAAPTSPPSGSLIPLEPRASKGVLSIWKVIAALNRPAPVSQSFF